MRTNLPLIFYADDDAAFLHLFQLGIGENGPTYQIKCFQNGEALVSSMAKLHGGFGLLPHLILLDLDMPVMDGITTLQALKKHPVFRKIPVIIISDSEDQEMQSNVFEYGAEAFIPKPMAFAGIQDIIGQIDAHLPKPKPQKEN